MAPNTPAVPTIKLAQDGGIMPVLGFGTAPDPPVPAETTRAAVIAAIQAGYRHFDTACLYHTEQPLGEAIAEALEKGLIQSRDELFITSKLWCSDARRDLVIPALNTTLRYSKFSQFKLPQISPLFVFLFVFSFCIFAEACKNKESCNTKTGYIF